MSVARFAAGAAALLFGATAAFADATHRLVPVTYGFTQPTFDPGFQMGRTYSFDLLMDAPSEDWLFSYIRHAETYEGAHFYFNPFSPRLGPVPPSDFSERLGFATYDLEADTFLLSPDGDGQPNNFHFVVESPNFFKALWFNIPPVPTPSPAHVARFTIVVPAGMHPTLQPSGNPILSITGVSSTKECPTALVPMSIAVYSGLGGAPDPNHPGNPDAVRSRPSCSAGQHPSSPPPTNPSPSPNPAPNIPTLPPSNTPGGPRIPYRIIRDPNIPTRFFIEVPPNTPDLDDPAAFEDDDGDGIPNLVDNCRLTFNPDQADRDGDLVGDVCDGCPDDPQKAEPGRCGCFVPGDEDTDGDGIIDCQDNCPLFFNPFQVDSDGDGLGDACDPQPFIAKRASDAIDPAAPELSEQNAGASGDGGTPDAEQSARPTGLCGFGLLGAAPAIFVTLLGAKAARRRGEMSSSTQGIRD
ncbi:MAG: thrombospondin type 3 repeat-containing protein [Phycisphaerae bacterium]